MGLSLTGSGPPPEGHEPRPEAARWRPSRFNLWAAGDRSTQLVFNSLTGAFVELSDQVGRGLREWDGEAAGAGPPPLPDDIRKALLSAGIIVPADADELRRAELVHQDLRHRDDRLRLIIMPTEKCNFRCVYCYEDFARGKMTPATRTAVLRLVQDQPGLQALTVSWFGGEPLTALDVVEDLSQQLLSHCRDRGISYGASMTTNGYLLSPDTAARCLAAGVRRFQITLDGPPSTHNTLRVLASGGPTFDRIHANLRSLAQSDEELEVRLRINYTPAVAGVLPGFLAQLGADFGADPRFSVNCHAVGHWGGPHDESVDVCDAKSAADVEVAFMGQAGAAGFDLGYWRDSMRPFGSVCYAADPRSFVIGSDGTVYKCTVAFDDPRNHVGQLNPDGSLALDPQLHELWLSSGEETDSGCRACAFRPACQGNYCPLERIQTGHKTCPPVKVDPGRYLPLLAVEARAKNHA